MERIDWGLFIGGQRDENARSQQISSGMLLQSASTGLMLVIPSLAQVSFRRSSIGLLESKAMIWFALREKGIANVPGPHPISKTVPERRPSESSFAITLLTILA
jgi:hypothetical protein